MSYRLNGYKFSFNKPQTPSETPKFISIEIDPEQLQPHKNIPHISSGRSNDQHVDSFYPRKNNEKIKNKRHSKTSPIHNIISQPQLKRDPLIKNRDLIIKNKRTVDRIFSKERLVRTRERQTRNQHQNKSIIEMWNLRDQETTLKRLYHSSKTIPSEDKQQPKLIKNKSTLTSIIQFQTLIADNTLNTNTHKINNKLNNIPYFNPNKLQTIKPNHKKIIIPLFHKAKQSNNTINHLVNKINALSIQTQIDISSSQEIK